MADEPEDMQLNLYGGEVPLTKVMEDSTCTRDAQCKAPVDGHHEDCPVEQELREVFGF